MVLGFFLRRTGDPELTADLTAEVFAAALLAAERYRPGERPALAWLYGIAAHKLADSRRRGRVDDAARRGWRWSRSNGSGSVACGYSAAMIRSGVPTGNDQERSAGASRTGSPR